MKRIEILKGLLITQMNHWILCTIGITLLGVSESDGLYLPQLLLLGMLPFALFLPRILTDGFIFFAVSHILAIGTAALLAVYPLWGNLQPMLVLSLYIAGYALLSFVARVQKKDRLERAIHPIVAIVITALMLALQRFQGIEGLDSYYMIAFIVYIGLYYICYYLKNFRALIDENDSAAGYVPEREIFKTGIRLVCFFTVFVTVLLLTLSQLDLAYEATVRLPTSEDDRHEEAMPPIFEEFTNFEEFFPTEDVFPEEESEPVDVLPMRILATLSFCILGAAVLYGLIMLFLFLRERFKLRFGKMPELDSIIDVREKVDAVNAKPESRSIFSYFSPRERIRRIYKKRVLEGKSLLVGDGEPELLGTYTAYECGQILDARVLASLYDKARYSELECTTEDVKAARG